MTMQDETIVAVYDTAAHADAAVRDLIAFGIAQSSISRHGGQNTAADTTATMDTAPREQGFWSRLFGGEPDHDTELYDRSIDSGSTVVTVRATDANADDVMDILDKHAPVDLDERASSYSLGQSGTTGTSGMTSAATSSSAVPLVGMPAGTATSTMGATTSDAASSGLGTTTAPTLATGSTTGLATGATTGAAGTDSETIQLAEERLSVGKRLINAGGTRVRRFVVETPVEEQVTLHSERVTLERHPVTDGRPVTDSAFTETTIEMVETSEEAVVAKNTVVTEEVSLRKESTDRVETVRDTVRREDVEIEQGVTDSVLRPTR
jgi:uncharacterized protein (TIGR02271 family)